MTYQVLARKWRPKDFASLVGQEHVVRALTHALDGGRLHHAYLFTGTRGVGKTTLSRIFAKALNCETGVTSKPCGVCRACREIDEGRFVDYVEMDAASNRGVDEMAALLERAVYAPVDARFKVYMIDEVHMLTNHAFNAMLKTLEEPPPHVKFILATTDPQKIPVTVLSRCLQFNLKQMPAGNIVEHLTHILGEEKVEFEPQALRLLARAADGSMRDALSLTDQAIAYSANQVTEEAVRGMLGALDQSYLIRLIDALVAGDGAQVLAIADEMALRSLSFSTALQDLASLFHRIAWAQFAPASVLDEWPEAEDLRRFADALSPEQVQLFYQIATLGRSELGLAPDEYAGFTMTLLRMLAFEPSTSAGSVGSAPASRPAAAGVARAAAPAASAASVASAAPVERVVAPKPIAPIAPVAPVAATRIEVPAETPAAAPAPKVETEKPVVEQTMSAPQARIVPPWEDEAAPEASEAKVEEAAPAPVAAASAPVAEPEPTTAPVELAAEPASPASRAAGGASAALDVLRNKGLRISPERGARGTTAAPATPVAQKATPRMEVKVPTPDPARRAAAAQEAQARQPARQASASQDASGAPPWDDIPPDDYVPLGADDAYFSSPDDGFAPSLESEARAPRAAAPAAPSAAVVDVSKLPPGIPLDAIGFNGDWPALAATLPLKGISYQLAFNSELTALDNGVLKLSVPVPQYAEASQVAKLKAALAESLGKTVELDVTVGPARRTAAALDAAMRAERQRDAERDIGADPFVQQLIRDFGASIVPGSIRPIVPEAAQGGSQAAH
ncbi:DNA polymerase-3 subunit gamma/tau [Paraburkholderia bannensis]|uniref:DNA polymerase III subunit gamma/tau n=1 Tax=Paraburkholderia bannensis TaxID=765414 RepID=A0A7W9U0E6_9BURK|nr:MULTISPECIES: DNA polymerase III subunit gamma/tau [Paraburkholderia]MBB3259716.1 DNA polymerase-3 subunit gamma/tau [Paraburkholderia sp. WP4_3_2]MBB6104732.1 DNA polymerase-3 subunit gamma/tau [Paraburkholderia bannensis]